MDLCDSVGEDQYRPVRAAKLVLSLSDGAIVTPSLNKFVCEGLM